jgi:hypothetical protein
LVGLPILDQVPFSGLEYWLMLKAIIFFTCLLTIIFFYVKAIIFCTCLLTNVKCVYL